MLEKLLQPSTSLVVCKEGERLGKEEEDGKGKSEGRDRWRVLTYCFERQAWKRVAATCLREPALSASACMEEFDI
ncbi:hypothetical protein GRJ2_001741900 [Grus japonensis]|uniref:Uncharacterized protein n=1 Tax=Grus japonensis TaxID=30415 RepID=A0ABC9X5B6_GRUJA